MKNGQPAREDSLGLRRALRPCSGRDLAVRSFKRYIKLRAGASKKLQRGGKEIIARAAAMLHRVALTPNVPGDV